MEEDANVAATDRMGDCALEEGEGRDAGEWSLGGRGGGGVEASGLITNDAFGGSGRGPAVE